MHKRVGFLACYASLVAALATPPNTASSKPPANYLIAPAASAGESVDSYLTQLFGPLDDLSSNSTASPNDTLSAQSIYRSEKRGFVPIGHYTETDGIHELTWDNDTIKTTYSLAIDLSDSCTGLNLSSPVGLYTFTNGTTLPSANLDDIISDVWTLTPTPSNPKRRWANHTSTLAQIALDEANDLLTNGQLLCSNSTSSKALAATSDSSLTPLHDELRHLLSSSWSYWVATIVSTIFGAALGASFAAGIQHHFSGNITAQNVVQTAAVVGATVLIGGILMRLHETGNIDQAAAAANRRAMAGRQAVIDNAHIARWREAFAAVRRMSQERTFALDGADTDRNLGGFSDGQTTPGSMVNGGAGTETPDRRTSGTFYCLSDYQAVNALKALGQMSSDEMRLKMMTAIAEDEQERMMNGEAASTLPTPSEINGDPGASRPESLRGSVCRNLDTATNSFRTAMGGFEASAADLVELANIAIEDPDEPESSNGERGNGNGGGNGGGALGSGPCWWTRGGDCGGNTNGDTNGGVPPGGLPKDEKGKGRADDQGGG